MTERICGTCSLCCKLPYVAELKKPIDTWCRHARPGNGGCSIYRDRPTSCRGFICGWLSDELKVGDEWFPTHCKMIISRAAEKGFLIIVDPAYPNAWRREPYYGQLLALAQRNLVKIRVGRRFIGLNADGSEEQVIRTQAWIEGRPEHALVR
jgi:hypothetical protein